MKNPGFIFVDDDRLVLIFGKMLLKKTVGDVEVETFDVPEEGLNYLRSGLSTFAEGRPVLLFLDINMPGMDGWEFLDHYSRLGQAIKERIHIYILSSSVDDRDKNRGAANPDVKGYLVKPLTKEALQQCIQACSLQATF